MLFYVTGMRLNMPIKICEGEARNTILNVEYLKQP